MKLVITIDTEEDNWGEYDLSIYSLRNLERIGRIQEIFDRFGVTPTYLVTYPVATDKAASALLRKIMEDGRCEIGAHCHPWNTPPFEEERNARNSMLCNLPASLQRRKIMALHAAIKAGFGIEPASFRTGRWGLGVDTPSILHQLGYRVDSSTIAFQNWEEYGGPDYSCTLPNPFSWENQGEAIPGTFPLLLELPASAGFVQGNFSWCNRLWLLSGGHFARRLHIRGIMDRLGILNKIWLSPETSNSTQMIKLTNAMRREGYGIVNMFFHSTALMAGLSSFVQTKEDEEHFLQTIEDYLVFARDAGIGSIKLADAPLHASGARQQMQVASNNKSTDTGKP